MALSADAAAARAGVPVGEVSRLADLGLIGADGPGYTDADVRRIQIIEVLERAGLPLEGLAGLLRTGAFSLSFLDQAGYNVFASLTGVTFAQLSERLGVPVDRLLALRDVTGGKAAAPDDLVRDDEMEVVPLVEYQLELGFRWPAIERALRVYGDSLRRIAEAEAEWWRSEVQGPMLAGGAPANELATRAAEISPQLSVRSDRAVMAIYHAQQMQVWSTNIVDGVATALEQAGLHTKVEQTPAMCFLDVSGYTGLTQERGDQAAVELVERLTRIVQRISVEHGGRPVKWLGDGVMVHFPDPGEGVVAALEMVATIDDEGLPPAHVGLHAGPIVIQEGDYYGQTVNLASRIGEYARPGEVLVSQAVIDAAGERPPIRFEPIGEIALKGVTGLVDLFSARADS